MVKPLSAFLEMLAPRMGTECSLDVHMVENSAKMDEISSQIRCGIILFHLAKRDQILKVINSLRAFKPMIAKGTLKVIVVTPFKQPEVLEALKEYGCTEAIIEPVQEKTLLFKLRRLSQILSSSKPDASLAGERVIKDKSKKPGKEEEKSKGAIRMAAPLLIRSDCWLYQESSARKFLGRWVFRLVGPGPGSGKWVERENTTFGADRIWNWIPANPEKDPFTHEPGRWVFTGNRPEFQQECWTFGGKNPSLCFESTDPAILAKKVALDDTGTLLIAADSAAGVAFLPLIQATLDFEIHMKGSQKKDNEEEMTLKEAKKERKRKGETGEKSEDSDEGASKTPATDESAYGSFSGSLPQENREDQETPDENTDEKSNDERDRAPKEPRVGSHDPEGILENYRNGHGGSSEPQVGSSQGPNKPEGTRPDYSSLGKTVANAERNPAKQLGTKQPLGGRLAKPEGSGKGSGNSTATDTDPARAGVTEGMAKEHPKSKPAMTADPSAPVLEPHSSQGKRLAAVDQPQKDEAQSKLKEPEKQGRADPVAGIVPSAAKNSTPLVDFARDVAQGAETENAEELKEKLEKMARNLQQRFHTARRSRSREDQLAPMDRFEASLINPLLLGIFVSEYNSRIGVNPWDIASRLARMLAESCEQLRVEVWRNGNQVWECVAASDSEHPCFDMIAKESTQELKTLPDAEFGSILGIPIFSMDREFLGVLTLGGPGIETFEPSYAESIAPLFAGIMRSIDAIPRVA